MRNLTFLFLSVFIFTAFHVIAQEPEVKILANPESSKKDEVLLKDGTTIVKTIGEIKEGEYITIGRKTYQWNEISTIKLSKNSLNYRSPNWGAQFPIHYDSTLLTDRILMNDGSVTVGTIYDFNQYYQIRMETNSREYVSLYWNNMKEVTLGKGSPFLAYSTDPLYKGEAAPETPEGESKLKVNKNGLKFGYNQELNTDQIRKAWQIRGGPIRCNESFFSLSLMSTSSSSSMKMTGTGFSYGAAVSYINLKPPSYADGNNSTSAFKIGINYNMQMFFTKVTADGMDDMKGNQYNFGIGLNVGFQKGFGRFLDSENWKGVVAGIAWRPSLQLNSYNYSFTMSGHTYYVDDSSTDFNLGGYELYIDFANLQAITSKFVKPAHMKLFFILIPPMGDLKMTFMQIGFGMVTY